MFIGPMHLSFAQTDEPQAVQWFIEAMSSDDGSAMLVNGQVVNVIVADDVNRGNSGPVEITSLLQPGDNLVSFISWNAGGPGGWHFTLRRGEDVVWENQAPAEGEAFVTYTQTVLLNDRGEVTLLDPDIAEAPVPGTWLIRQRDIDDVSLVVINDRPVFATVRGSSDWFDISPYLRSDQDNEVEVQVWNLSEGYNGRFVLNHDDTLVWGRETNGTSEPGLAYRARAIVQGDGDVIDSTELGEWAARIYNSDNVMALFVNGKAISVVRLDDANGGDSGWINLNEHLRPNETNTVTFMAWDWGTPGAWGAALSRNGVTVWGSEGTTEQDFAPILTQSMTIDPGGLLSMAPHPPVPSTPATSSTWLVRSVDCQDACFIFLNDVLIQASFMEMQADWLDISDMLFPGRDNILRMEAWNIDGDYAWSFAIQKDDAVEWESQFSGADQQGLIYDVSLVVDTSEELSE
jgi:hypothetical protein